MITIRHEDFIRSPASALSTVCTFLGLEHDADYLAECSSIVFERPTGSRRRVAWSTAQVCEVQRRLRHYPFLQGYEFESANEPERHALDSFTLSAAVTPSRRPTANRAHAAIERFAAYINPRVRPTPDTGDA